MFKKILLPVNIKQFDNAITLDAVKKFFADNQNNEEVKAYLLGLNPITVEGVKKFVTENAEAKAWLDSEKDKHSSKSLETWKTNNLQKLIDDEVAKRNPAKTPEQIELEKLRKEIEEERKSRTRQELVNKALKVADEKQLPKDIIDFFIADDEENTLANLSKLEEEYSKAVQAAVDAKFKAGGRDVETGSGSGGSGAIDIGALAAEVSIRN